MQPVTSHAGILNTVFGYLPDDEVERLRQLPVDEVATHVQILAAVRHHRIHLPDRVVQDFVASLTQLLQ